MTKARLTSEDCGPITLERIDHAIAVALQVIDLHGSAYLPILKRLLEERDAFVDGEKLIARARAIVRGAE